ncbi:MAG: DUF3737 family protein [Ruminococcaceae bacterium]|nr:DUF3737 family protein [Oscillospiraceae bacterium]
MKIITGKNFDEERALYGSRGVYAVACRFDGPADGESAFKESSGITAENCFFNLRYPFWHDMDVNIQNCEMTEFCRAALWYSERIMIADSRLHGIKALRECREIIIKGCNIRSPEFGWFSCDINMEKSSAEGEYFMLRAQKLNFHDVTLNGKYSFQYITDSVFENCRFDTKDAFWHAKNVLVKNSVIKGEYLAWYCENVTFENCVIEGTQPLCYCKNLKLINCEMHGADFAFEKSTVEADITTPVISIKNPKEGKIVVPSVQEMILTEQSSCIIEVQNG